MISPDRTPEALAAHFQHFAVDCEPSSPLYNALSLSIADDSELLALAGYCRTDQPAPNLLFGAVHFLLLQGVQHPLVDYYLSLGAENGPPAKAFSHFREFCFENQEAIIPILMTRRVQTNEVRRSAFLYPSFSYISNLTKKAPFTLIEIGASAGLNLNWDKFTYSYGKGIQRGDAQSPVHINSAIRGSKRPPAPENFPEISIRLGLELHPISLENDEECLWLEALIWPEHLERIRLLHAAIDLWKAHPQKIIAGDAVEILPKVLASLPDDSPLVVYNSMALYQFSNGQVKQLLQILADASKEHSLFHLSAEWDGVEQIEILLTDYSTAQRTQLANGESHGRWIEWLVD